MTTQTVSLELPEQLYQQLTEASAASKRPLGEIILQSIRVGLPPNIDHLPEPLRSDLHALDQLSDVALWHMAGSELDDRRAALYEELLERNQDGALAVIERNQLTHLREEADLIMLRSSYAYALLKWRGHRIPTAAEMQVP